MNHTMMATQPHCATLGASTGSALHSTVRSANGQAAANDADVRPRASMRATLRRHGLAALGLAFALFSTARLLAYLPMIWAIHSSGDSSQHSLWTWCIWFGANTTMGLSMLEQGGRAARRTAAVCAGNASMCAIVFTLIVLHR